MPTINIGEKLDLNNINLKVSAMGIDAEGNQYKADADELNYTFSIGSGKHSDCYTYDTSDVDTSEAGWYYIHVTAVPDFADKFVLENSLSIKLPNGTYKFVMQDKNFDIPVDVIDPSIPIATEPVYTGVTTTTSIHSTATNTTATIITTTNTPVIKEIKGYFRPEKFCYYIPVNEEFDPNIINILFNMDIINEDGSELPCSADTPPYEKLADLYTIDASKIDTSKLGRYYLKSESVGGTTEKFDIKNAYYLPDGEYEIEMKPQSYDVEIFVTNDTEYLNPPVNTTQSGNSDTIITATTTTVTIPKEPTVIKEIKGYITPKKYYNYISYLGEEIDPKKIELELVLHIINKDGTEIFRVTECDINSLSEKYANCYTFDTSNINTSELGNYSLKVECIGGAVNTFDIKNVLGLKDGEYEIEMEANVSYIEVYVNNKPETTTTINGSQSGNSTETTAVTGTTMPIINLNPETTKPTTTVSDTSKTTENTNTAADYRTMLEYDNSPMKIGETREIHVYNPATGMTSNAYISEASDNISVSYTDGSDIVYITALEAGDTTLYIRESGCAFGNYVNLTITEEQFSETITTTEENTPETTTTTTQPAEELPQTGYSDIYNWIVYFALFITATGTAVIIYSKKRVK